VLTDNGTEFVGKAERLVQALKGALVGMLRKKHYGTIAELQANLDRWLAWDNIQRPPPGPSQPGEAAVAGHPRVPDPAGIEGGIAKSSRKAGQVSVSL
jgi:hypothetical protein